MPPPNKVDPLAYVAAVTRAAHLVQSGTDLDVMAEALERARAVRAHPDLVSALERRIRRGARIKLMLAQARIAAARHRLRRGDG